jgi:signal transduction histidine kinase
VNEGFFGSRLKTILAGVWLVLTLTLVGWWWFYFLHHTESQDPAHHMFLWEGSVLIGFVLLGGSTLVVLTYRDERRHASLRFFFSNFTHDLKTSISRLRLQAEVLQEEATSQSNPIFERLLTDVSRLDLQLENSLLLANLQDSPFFFESLSLHELIQALREDFSHLEVNLSQNANVRVDKRAFLSVLRNLFQNSVIHGGATRVRIDVEPKSSRVQIRVQDNGNGFRGDHRELGAAILRLQGARGNGIGLFLSRSLLEKMKGTLSFPHKSQEGFEVVISVPGVSS